jgi:hypothetical protein
MGDEPISIPGQVEDEPVVGNKIDRSAELLFHVRRPRATPALLTCVYQVLIGRSACGWVRRNRRRVRSATTCLCNLLQFVSKMVTRTSAVHARESDSKPSRRSGFGARRRLAPLQNTC